MALALVMTLVMVVLLIARVALRRGIGMRGRAAAVGALTRGVRLANEMEISGRVMLSTVAGVGVIKLGIAMGPAKTMRGRVGLPAVGLAAVGAAVVGLVGMSGRDRRGMDKRGRAAAVGASVTAETGRLLGERIAGKDIEKNVGAVGFFVVGLRVSTMIFGVGRKVVGWGVGFSGNVGLGVGLGGSVGLGVGLGGNVGRSVGGGVGFSVG